MIEVHQVRKKYKRANALDGFSLRVAEGELFGLVGPNGAGKTTLIKILSTLIPPTDGQIRIADLDVTRDPQSVKRIVGYMPDQPGLYQDMRVREFLEFFADAFRVPSQKRVATVELALDRCGLASSNNTFVEELSFGMRQRLLMAKTLLHEPRVLLLDEPATGLDPLARIDLRNQLKQLNAQGVTILVSSHILSDLEDICSRVALIKDGRNAAGDDGQAVIDLRKLGPSAQLYEVEIIGESEAAARVAAEILGVRVLQAQHSKLLLEIEGEAAQVSKVLSILVASSIQVVKFGHPTGSLEDRYREAFGKKSGGTGS
jgi:ABC-2 type transport system ATP-binding protein